MNPELDEAYAKMIELERQRDAAISRFHLSRVTHYCLLSRLLGGKKFTKREIMRELKSIDLD